MLNSPLLYKEKRYNWPLFDIDIGLHFFKVSNTPGSARGSPRKFSHLGLNASLTICQQFLKFDGDYYALCIFGKPGYVVASEAAGSTRVHNSWGIAQLPFGLALKIGGSYSKNSSWDGVMIGAGLTYNAYYLAKDNIPDLKMSIPRFYSFLQLHFNEAGFRFGATQSQNFMNKDGSVTKTGWEYTLTFLVTIPG